LNVIVESLKLIRESTGVTGANLCPALADKQICVLTSGELAGLGVEGSQSCPTVAEYVVLTGTTIINAEYFHSNDDSDNDNDDNV